MDTDRDTDMDNRLGNAVHTMFTLSPLASWSQFALLGEQGHQNVAWPQLLVSMLVVIS